jgi:hypothetical protein
MSLSQLNSKRAYEESRLMELHLFHSRQTGSTLEQFFLGTKAFSTIEPANLKAILSTKFEGLEVATPLLAS